MEKGLIHIYHGDGKGKTTAAVGLAVRAAGSGMHVAFIQLMKDGTSAELDMLKKIERIEVFAIKNSYGFTWNMSDDDRIQLRMRNDKAVNAIIKAAKEELYQMFVVDELMSAYQGGFVDKLAVIELMQLCKGTTELVFTGRNPARELLDRADYITEMKNVKHPYEKGIGARAGIER
ncbi:MAG: cob(I)yrinic acid a,c-diamide adenosyltransferase [Lachnospiraceae bacterium]|nr:cob(I)yrinic acid a,c-diamide adenosyltransferase [Lachnospiraceae bacterium]